MPYALSVLRDACAPCGVHLKRKTTIRRECVCPNKRIKGPLCLREEDWWGRDLPLSLFLSGLTPRLSPAERGRHTQMDAVFLSVTPLSLSLSVF